MARKRRRNNRPAKTPGRAKGTRNLQRVDGGFVNQNDVFITEDEKKALERAVRKANKKRKALEELFDPLPYKIEGQETGMTVGERRLTLGTEVDFSIAEKTASIQRFKSHEEFERYMKNLNRVNSDNYIAERSRLYKRNYQAALLNPETGLGLAYDDVSDILMKIRTMKTEDYLQKVASNEELSIGYLYDEGEGGIDMKLNAIRSALELPHRELDHFWEGDEF